MKKLFIPDTSKYIGKTLKEVKEGIEKEYGDKYDFATTDLKLEDYPELKDGNLYFFFGSTFRVSSGNVHVPFSYWDVSKFYRDYLWLDDDWYSGCRVLLLDKSLDTIESMTLELSEAIKVCKEAGMLVYKVM